MERVLQSKIKIMKLFEIALEGRQLKEDLLEFAKLNEGEIPDELMKKLSINKDEMAEKIRRCFYILEEFNAEITALQAQEKKWQKKRNTVQNSVTWLKKYIGECLELYGETNKTGNRFFQDPDKMFKVTASRSKKVCILDETLVPDEFKEEEVSVKIDKKALGNVLKSGKEVDGCFLDTDTINVNFR
jgi:hypothetical protein